MPLPIPRCLVTIAAALLGALAIVPAAVAAPTALDAFGGQPSLAPGAGGVAVAPTGRVYVADTANQRVVQFAPDGSPLGIFKGLGSGSPRTNGPVGVAVDSAGRVFVTETGGDRLLAFTAAGEALGASGGHGSDTGRLDDPAGVAVARDGSILVVDRGNARVQAFAPTGGRVGGWSGSLVDPYGIAVGPDGHVYVTDRATASVHRFRADGTFVTAFGTAGALGDPTGIVVDRDGAVHVADAARDHVATFTPDGGAETWGGGLAAPAGLATDCRASVYVVDDALVRRFGRPGVANPPCNPPVAAFGITPVEAMRGTPVFLDGSASTDDSRLVRFDWDLDGDGIFDAGSADATLSHAFDRAGANPITLRVTDDDGEQSQTTKAVTVLAPEPFRAQQRAPRPELGVSALAARVSGQVLVRRPGAAKDEPLTGSRLVPMGTVLDTTQGRVRLTFATGDGDGTQTGEFWDGRFSIFQATTAPLAELVLADEPQAGDRTKARAAARRKRSRLWGDAKGSFRTSGRNATATVRGTVWLTDDGAAGTRVKVDEGAVAVRDLVRDRTVEVRAGDEYTARDACRSKRRFQIRLRVPHGVAVRSALVLHRGRRLPVRMRDGRLTAVVDLRGRPKGTEIIRIALVTTTGARLTGTRRYDTCAATDTARVPPI